MIYKIELLHAIMLDIQNRIIACYNDIQNRIIACYNKNIYIATLSRASSRLKLSNNLLNVYEHMLDWLAPLGRNTLIPS